MGHYCKGSTVYIYPSNYHPLSFICWFEKLSWILFWEFLGMSLMISFLTWQAKSLFYKFHTFHWSPQKKTDIAHYSQSSSWGCIPYRAGVRPNSRKFDTFWKSSETILWPVAVCEELSSYVGAWSLLFKKTDTSYSISSQEHASVSWPPLTFPILWICTDVPPPTGSGERLGASPRLAHLIIKSHHRWISHNANSTDFTWCQWSTCNRSTVLYHEWNHWNICTSCDRAYCPCCGYCTGHGQHLKVL